MNIFVLHRRAGKAAMLHCDAHVIKMLLETTQILYTYLDSIGYVLPATNAYGKTIVPYKPTHRHHPCVLWLHGGRAHLKWLLQLANNLCFVYMRIYDKVHAHDMSKYPWPFPSNTYDGSMCNGVLIYVDDPNCLDEFVRVMKPGGICVIMFRHDGYPDYEAKDMQLRREGKWELVHKTPDQRNFDNMEFGENNEEDVVFNQWVFRVLEKSADIKL